MPDMADQYQDTAGSIDPVEPAYVLIGRLQKSHGVRGEISMRVFSDFPERIRRGKIIYLGSDFQANKITGTRWKNELLLLKLEGFDNPESLRELVGKEVFSAVKNLPPLPEGKYYHHQLIRVYGFGKATRTWGCWLPSWKPARTRSTSLTRQMAVNCCCRQFQT